MGLSSRTTKTSVSWKLPSAAILLTVACQGAALYGCECGVCGLGAGLRGGGVCVGGFDRALLWTGRGDRSPPCAVAAGEEVNWAPAEPRRCLGYWQVGTWGLLQDRNTLPEAWLPPQPACLRGREGCKREGREGRMERLGEGKNLRFCPPNWEALWFPKSPFHWYLTGIHFIWKQKYTKSQVVSQALESNLTYHMLKTKLTLDQLWFSTDYLKPLNSNTVSPNYHSLLPLKTATLTNYPSTSWKRNRTNFNYWTYAGYKGKITHHPWRICWTSTISTLLLSLSEEPTI